MNCLLESLESVFWRFSWTTTMRYQPMCVVWVFLNHLELRPPRVEETRILEQRLCRKDPPHGSVESLAFAVLPVHQTEYREESAERSKCEHLCQI